MTNFSHDNREPPMLNDSERPVLPSLNSTTSGHSGLKIFIFDLHAGIEFKELSLKGG